MKTASKYNKSAIMKKAWFGVKVFGLTMSIALKRAWGEAKVAAMYGSAAEQAERRRQLRKPISIRPVRIQETASSSVPYYEGAEAYYQSGRRYYGD